MLRAFPLAHVESENALTRHPQIGKIARAPRGQIRMSAELCPERPAGRRQGTSRCVEGRWMQLLRWAAGVLDSRLGMSGRSRL